MLPRTGRRTNLRKYDAALIGTVFYQPCFLQSPGAACATTDVCPFDIRVVSTALVRGLRESAGTPVLDMHRLRWAGARFAPSAASTSTWLAALSGLASPTLSNARSHIRHSSGPHLPGVQDCGQSTHGGHGVAASSAAIAGLYFVMHLRRVLSTKISVFFFRHPNNSELEQTYGAWSLLRRRLRERTTISVAT